MTGAATDIGQPAALHISLRRRPSMVLLGAGAVLMLAGCDSSGGTASLAPISTVAAASGGTTSMTVSGAVTGTLTSLGASCVTARPAGVEVTIQGALGGGTYLLAFDAPKGTTNLAATKSPHVVVELASLQGTGNWGANPSRQLGSGTLVVKATGGRLDLHLVAGPGGTSPAPANSPSGPVDISGSYGCSSRV